MKKLLLLLFSLFFAICFSKPSSEDIHPYHVGSVEFNYNSKAETFEISGKFFLDDLEKKYDQEKRQVANAISFGTYKKAVTDHV